MPVPAVRQKIRVRLPDGSRAYVDPVLSPNAKLKPHYALVTGKPEHHPEGVYHLREGVYHLRYVKGGRRVWEAVGSDPQQALTAKSQVEHKLQAIALGVAAPDPVVVRSSDKTDLTKAIVEYLKDTAAGKSKRTNFAYSYTLKTFTAVCNKKTLEQVERRDILNFVAHLSGLGNGPRTVSNYVNSLLTFFLHHKVPWPLLKTVWFR
jgi:integrase/recombinase XerD